MNGIGRPRGDEKGGQPLRSSHPSRSGITVSLSRPARSWGQRLLDGYLAFLVITLKALAGAVCGIVLVVMLYLMKVILTG
jgi:hypothetical protein